MRRGCKRAYGGGSTKLGSWLDVETREKRSRSCWGVHPGGWAVDSLQIGVWEEGLPKAFRS